MNTIRIKRNDGTVLVCTPVPGMPFQYSTKFEDGTEYHIGQRLEQLANARTESL